MKFISTAGHGYLRVTKKQVNSAISQGFKPSAYSFYNDKCALLEEDCDMGKYLKITGKPNVIKSVVYQNDINRNVYERF